MMYIPAIRVETTTTPEPTTPPGTHCYFLVELRYTPIACAGVSSHILNVYLWI